MLKRGSKRVIITNDPILQLGARWALKVLAENKTLLRFLRSLSNSLQQKFNPSRRNRVRRIDRASILSSYAFSSKITYNDFRARSVDYNLV